MKYHNYIRCPICGKISMLPSYFTTGMEHKIELMIQTIGGNKNIKWNHKEMPNNLLKLLHLKLVGESLRLERILRTERHVTLLIEPGIIDTTGYIDSPALIDASIGLIDSVIATIEPGMVEVETNV